MWWEDTALCKKQLYTHQIYFKQIGVYFGLQHCPPLSEFAKGDAGYSCLGFQNNQVYYDPFHSVGFLQL